MSGAKNKTLTVWLAVLGGSMGLHRFYLRGLGDLAVTDVRSDSPTTIGANPAQWAHASVTGTLTAGAEERSEVSLLLVGLPNGRHFVFIEVKPDRPSAAPHLAAIDAAARSITAAP